MRASECSLPPARPRLRHLARGFPLSMQKMRESGCAVRGAVRIAAARRWRRMRRCTSSSRSVCVANGRLRQAGEGAVRRACSARRNGTPGGILPLRVCTVLPRGDPFVAVYGPATATCLPTPALSGSGVSPSIRPVLLLPATRPPVVCRTGFPTADRIQASVAMPRRVSNGGIRVSRQTMETTRRGRQVLANVVHLGLPEPALRLPPWRSSARSALP